MSDTVGGDWNNFSKRPYSPVDHVDNEGSKRRNTGDERSSYVPVSEDIVYRYLCPRRKAGSIIGRGGEIVKQMRADSQANILVGENISGCEERVVTICSSTEEIRSFGDKGDYICPAQDALFRVHEMLLHNESASLDDYHMGASQATARLLVPSDQVGFIIGRGGRTIHGLRNDTGAQIRISKNDNPLCANNNDELLQISGVAEAVNKALFQVSYRLQGKPSGSLHAVGDWSSLYPLKHTSSAKKFALCLVCPADNIGKVIGKGGVIIHQIRKESGASIKVDSSAADDDCIIEISAEEAYEDPTSATIDAAVRLQARCSLVTETKSGERSYTSRLLVPRSQIGRLIGKGGSIINEVRKATQATIRIGSKENLPEVAFENDELIQISGDLDIIENALIKITTLLRDNLFGKKSALSAFSSENHEEYGASKSGGNGYGTSGGTSYSGSNGFSGPSIASQWERET